MSNRKSEKERRSLVQFGFDPDAAPVALNHSLANCETDARAGNLFAMKSFEHTEDFFMVLRSNPNAVVGHRKTPNAILLFGRNLNVRKPFRPILDGVTACSNRRR